MEESLYVKLRCADGVSGPTSVGCLVFGVWSTQKHCFFLLRVLCLGRISTVTSLKDKLKIGAIILRLSVNPFNSTATDNYRYSSNKQ